MDHGRDDHGESDRGPEHLCPDERALTQGEGKVVVLRKEAQINVVVRHDVSPYLVKVRRTRKEIVAVII